MAMLSKESELGLRQEAKMLNFGLRGISSQMIEAVRSGVLREVSDHPDRVPAIMAPSLGGLVQSQTAACQISGPAHSAGWRIDRYPGERDPLKQGHPIWDTMIKTIRQARPAATKVEIDRLLKPENEADLLQACIFRYAPLIGPGADLTVIYRDASGRSVLDSQYVCTAYDADHRIDQIMLQVLDFTFIDWVKLLNSLRLTSPEMFDAVWHRNATEVDALIRVQELPVIKCLRKHKEPEQKFRLLVSSFWEFERLFELLMAFGGKDRVTMGSIKAVLSSSVCCAAAVAQDGRVAHYLATTWCHQPSLRTLIHQGCDLSHDARHPHRAFGHSGVAAGVRELHTIGTAAAMQVAYDSVSTAPPFKRDSRLRQIGGDMPAHFFAGRDVRTLAVRCVLKMRGELGTHRGGNYNPHGRIFEFEILGAIGRLAMIITHRFCPDTVEAVLTESSFSFNDSRSKLMPLLPSDLAGDPVEWHRLYGGYFVRFSAAAKRAFLLTGNAGRNNLLHSLVDGVRKDQNDLLTQCATQTGYSAEFSALIWFSRYAEASGLSNAWIAAPPKLKQALPALFPDVDPADLKFASRVAADMWPSALPFLQDPHWRKPDALRPIKRKKLTRVNPARTQKVIRTRGASTRSEINTIASSQCSP